MDALDRPASLADRVAYSLRNAIQDGEFEFGEALSEAGLAEQFCVSRTPVREAFATLQREGLVMVRPQRGTFVFKLTSTEFSEICDCRTDLETAALHHAMSQNRVVLAVRLEGIVKEMQAALDAGLTQQYLRLDRDFHQSFFDFCENRYLSAAYGIISGQIAALRSRLGTDAGHMEKSFTEHCAITHHIRAGDTVKVGPLIIGHIGRKEGSYWIELCPKVGDGLK
jgi:DNA-binding GntR family transcriptional regulator